MVLATDSGSIITSNTGAELDPDLPTSNHDIQEFDFFVSLLASILWQYQDASSLVAIIAGKQDWYDDNQKSFWTDFITNIFNLRTANEFGLSVWSIILDFPLFVNQPFDPDKPTFGFDLDIYGNFDNSNFTDNNGTTFNLPLETKRIILKLRYFQLVSSGTVPETNRMLKYVFEDFGKAYLLDFGNMEQEYVFIFPVTWDLAYVFNNLDLLPRPAGVGSSWIDATLTYFGFGPDGGQFDLSILGPN